MVEQRSTALEVETLVAPERSEESLGRNEEQIKRINAIIDRELEYAYKSICRGVKNPEDRPTKEQVRRMIESSPVVEISEEVMAKARKPWQFSLIGKFLGPTIRYEVVKERLTSIWKTESEYKVIEFVHGFYIFQIKCEADRFKIWRNGPYVVRGEILALMKWIPNFRGQGKIDTALVWFSLPGLPIEWWDKEKLETIAGEAGKLYSVDIDETTGECFARAYVEAYLNKPLVPGTWVGSDEDGWWQEFRYENIPSVCYRCRVLEHNQWACPEARLAHKIHPLEHMNRLSLKDRRGPAAKLRMIQNNPN